MSRLKITFALTLLMLSSVASDIPTSGVGTAWDVSPADRADYYPANQLTSPRFADAPYAIRYVSGTGPSLARPKISNERDETSRRGRRDADSKMEKVVGSKNVREARMNNSPETWSKQPFSVEFRHRTSFDQLAPGNYEENVDNDEAANLPPLIRAHYAPKTNFVTSGRGRSQVDGRLSAHVENRESRDLPVARSYDDYEVPIFRNIVREHDFDVQIPRNYYYPNRYRSQRDYYYRGAGGGVAANPYAYDRYRDEDEDYELYGRHRPTPKPKRIIYYATLPEIVRKPVDLRNYPRPYDPLVRGPETQIEAERNRVTPNNVEPIRRPLRYPYDNYDNYVKRSSYYDQRKPFYLADEDSRLREPERNRANYKDKMRSDDRKLESQITRSENDRRLPWPVQIGAKVSVKDTERIPGRKIFGQIEGYDRYEGSRVKKTSGNAQRKEDVDDNNNNNNSNTNNNSKNN